MPSIGRAKAVSAGEVAPCPNNKILVGELSRPARVLLRTNSWMPAPPDGIIASDVSSLGSLAFTDAKAKRPAARNVDITKKENRKSWPRIECLPDVFLEHGSERRDHARY